MGEGQLNSQLEKRRQETYKQSKSKRQIFISELKLVTEDLQEAGYTKDQAVQLTIAFYDRLR